MRILPLRFLDGDSFETLGITGEETFSLKGLEKLTPNQGVTLEVSNGKTLHIKSAIDTPIEIEYYLHGGIMPYVLRDLMKKIF